LVFWSASAGATHLDVDGATITVDSFPHHERLLDLRIDGLHDERACVRAGAAWTVSARTESDAQPVLVLRGDGDAIAIPASPAASDDRRRSATFHAFAPGRWRASFETRWADGTSTVTPLCELTVDGDAPR